MIIAASIIALIPAVLISVLALSKKTSPAVKRMSIVALILICLTFIVCMTMIFVTSGSSVGKIISGELPVLPVQETNQNMTDILVVSAVVMFFMIMVIVLAIREQRRK